MSEIKIIKKDSTEKDVLVVRQLIHTVKSDIADIKRRVNGVLVPLEEKIKEWEQIEKQLK